MDMEDVFGTDDEGIPRSQPKSAPADFLSSAKADCWEGMAVPGEPAAFIAANIALSDCTLEFALFEKFSKQFSAASEVAGAAFSDAENCSIGTIQNTNICVKYINYYLVEELSVNKILE